MKPQAKQNATKLLTHRSAHAMISNRDTPYNARYVFKPADEKLIMELINSAPLMRHHITSITITAT